MILHLHHVADETAPSCGCGSDACTSDVSDPGKPAKNLSINWSDYRGSLLTAFMLVFGALAMHFGWFETLNAWVVILFYGVAWIPVGYPVLKKGLQLVSKGDVFTEFTLMSLASFGAFYIGEYPEGVAVLLFYTVGELFQEAAVRRARTNIKALLDVRPDTARWVSGNQSKIVHPEDMSIGDTIRVLSGERVPLDGVLISDHAAMDASALTGESVPVSLERGDEILSGMLNASTVVDIRVTRDFRHSTVTRILELVQDASQRKARTELFIRKFARVYTPLVTILAAMVVILPMFWVDEYVFDDWLYRGLVFLVISCPCALVISIPLGYFGGIGAASHHGILVKGGNYLDALLKVNTIVFDKTGTLTHGKFQVEKLVQFPGATPNWVEIAGEVERHSNHPIARAVSAHVDGLGLASATVIAIHEIPGKGIRAMYAGQDVMVGSTGWLKEMGHILPQKMEDNVGKTTIGVVVGDVFCGIFVMADRIRDGVADAIQSLKKQGIGRVVMLSGDQNEVVKQVAKEVGISEYCSDMLPADKASYLQDLKNEPGTVLAFVGDGINDAPSLALADVGIAMGGLGSDVAIETADIVLQNDHPKAIVKGLHIAGLTRNVVWQNIFLAMGVKVLVMVMGAMGIATLWEAVFADVGVALLAILNAIRIK